MKRRIAAMPWFYIAETPEASARLLHRCFPDAPDFTIPRDNRSAGSSQALDPADVEHLKLLNALDYEIYAVALRLQTERLARSADFVPSEAVNLD